MRLRRSTTIAAVAILLALVCGACSSADLPPARATMAVPETWAESHPPPVLLDLTRYWQLLDDPLLSAFVEAALAENLDLAQGAARVEQARAQLSFARAAYLPQVTGGGTARRDVGNFASDDLTFSLGADAAWEADLFGRIGANVAASRADLASVGYSLADLQRLITGQVALATISARATAVQLAIARDTLVNQDDNLQIARWRVQAGLVSSLDVEQARSQRAQTAATIPLLQSNLASTANAISTLIGEPPGRVLALLENIVVVPAPPETVGFAAPAEVLRRRPDVRSAEAALLADGARIDLARAQLLPLVQLGGTIGTSPANIGNLFDLVTGGLFASISQLLFDGGRTRAQIGSAEALAQGSLAAWQLTILDALEEVETAAFDLRTGRERVLIFEEALDAAENSAVLARSEYEAGLTDFRTLLTAENLLLSARNALVSAQAERASAFVRLTQALGGGWSPDADLMPNRNGANR